MQRRGQHVQSALPSGVEPGKAAGALAAERPDHNRNTGEAAGDRAEGCRIVQPSVQNVAGMLGCIGNLGLTKVAHEPPDDTGHPDLTVPVQIGDRYAQGTDVWLKKLVRQV